MKQNEKEDLRNRRDFLRQSACATLGVTGLVNALAQFRLITATMAQGGPFSDFKALICLFLYGGNDSSNLLVPAGDPASSEPRSDYEAGRGILALGSSALLPINVPAGTKAFDQYYNGNVVPIGVHPNCLHLANMFDAKDLAFIGNVGTLSYPFADRNEYLTGAVPAPPQLFSHSDQQTQWQSSIPDKPFQSGWGGRAAEILHASYNDPMASKVSASISISGVNQWQVGTTGAVQQYIVNPSGAVSLNGFGPQNDPYANAWDPITQTYKNTDQGKKLEAFETIMNLAHENLLENEYNKIVSRARLTEGVIGAALQAAGQSGVDFDANFVNAGTSLGDQLKMVAQLIAGRAPLGNNRQVYFVSAGGYDNHQTMLSAHGTLMSELSEALKAFKDTMVELGDWDKTLLFSASDFNRTFTPNGTNPNTSGSDHAWGSNQFVMGGKVKGGDLYGHIPAMKLGNTPGSIDADNNRGRWIPSISVDQYSKVITKWMGATENDLAAIFPNLGRFDDPCTSSTPNLDFMDYSTGGPTPKPVPDELLSQENKNLRP